MKQEKLSTEPYKGVRDFYPEEYRIRDEVFGCIKKILSLYGYEAYDASPLERAELYEAKTSEEIVSEQTYTFTDRGDRRVTLRPEMTPTLARMVSAKRRELTFPIRWFSIGNRFRYERPQKGRLREFYQVDVDLLGLSTAEADKEVLMLAVSILRELGADDTLFSLRVNSRTLLSVACREAGLGDESTRAYIRLLDKKKKISEGEYKKEMALLSTKDPLSLIEENATKDIQHERALLEDMIDSLKKSGVESVVFDPTITRGFDYYTGIVFEIFDTHKENPRSIFGGGRYDNLVGLFGGDKIPAVGFACGDVTLFDFLSLHNLLPSVTTPADVFIGTFPEYSARAEAFAHRLREHHIRVLLGTPEKSIGKQIAEAGKRNIPFFIAYGEKETTSGTLTLKSLTRAHEEILREEEVADTIQKTLG